MSRDNILYYAENFNESVTSCKYIISNLLKTVDQTIYDK